MKKTADIIKDNLPQFDSFIYGEFHNGNIKTEFTSLDRLIGGFLSNELIILGARPAMGKTSFMLSMAYNQAKQGKKVVIYSLDSNAQQIIYTLIGYITKIEQHLLNCGMVKKEDKPKIDAALKEIEALPIYIDDSNKTIYEIRDELITAKTNNEVDMVYIDYLQLLNHNRHKHYNREQEISSIMMDLKQLAKDINTPIFISSQLSRAVETRGGDKRPQLSDLRESGGIEEHADKVFFLHRAEYYGLTEDEYGNSTIAKANIIIAKNKNGYLGDVQLHFNAPNAMFCDLENNEIIDYMIEKLDLE